MTANAGKVIAPEITSLQITVYDIFITAVTAIALINMVVILLIPIHPAIQEILQIADWAICTIFLVDFFRSLLLADNRMRYFLRWGWLDLLGSIPSLPVFRLLRIIRTFRTFRELSGSRFRLRDVPRMMNERQAESTLMVTAVAVILVVTIGSSAIVMAEEHVQDAQIQTGGEAVWWAFQTISTVGYGDYVPITGTGRAIGIIMMLLGVSVFTVLTSYLATTFLTQRNRQADEAQTDELRAELDEIKALLRDIQQSQKMRETP